LNAASSPPRKKGIVMLAIYVLILLVAILMVYLLHALVDPENFRSSRLALQRFPSPPLVSRSTARSPTKR
jgi:K+-transporting ATPase KdpF subunit